MHDGVDTADHTHFPAQIPAPFKPEVRSETDVANFDTDFTSEAPELTPPDEGTVILTERVQ